MEPEVFLESWDRQALIISNLAEKVNPGNRDVRPSPEGMPLVEQLTHIHECRYHWLGHVSPEHQAKVGDVLVERDGEWLPIDDLEEIRRQLGGSAAAVRGAVEEGILQEKGQVGPYSHPAFFMQHMIWHEGYHAGMILLALRNAGEEPSDDWEEQFVWGIWRS